MSSKNSWYRLGYIYIIPFHLKVWGRGTNQLHVVITMPRWSELCSFRGSSNICICDLFRAADISFLASVWLAEALKISDDKKKQLKLHSAQKCFSSEAVQWKPCSKSLELKRSSQDFPTNHEELVVSFESGFTFRDWVHIFWLVVDLEAVDVLCYRSTQGGIFSSSQILQWLSMNLYMHRGI